MALKILDFTTKNGLVLCNNTIDVQNNAELLYLYEAKKLGASAVFFRRFYKENSPKPDHSEPSVCIFDKDESFFNSLEHIKLHAKLWSSGKNEVYIILSKTRIDIINARKPAEVVDDKKLSVKNLALVSTALESFNSQKFSAYLFGSGTFWEQAEFENKLDEKNSPYIHLLDYLMTVRKDFLDSNKIKLAPETTDKLLVVCILIKFLEEIKDDRGKHTLKIIYKIHKIESFAEALEKGLWLSILNDLAIEFNGEIFNRFSETEKESIQKTDLKMLSAFLRANVELETGQYFIWEQYSFKYLPAEVISAIYENFIQAESKRQNGEIEKGVVYTPIHLVNFLVDEVMPLNKPELFANQTFKILDPACGSGVFLVAAYKRLLQWWAINNSSEGNICYPQSKDAQKILEDNIYGIDVKETATLVSIFGLTTALLDKLTPPEIWNDFKFNDLSKKNIYNKNFFQWAKEAKQKELKFDLVIGNPPFNFETGKKKEDVLNHDVLKILNFKHKNIPKNNFALHFFEGSMALANKVCLIIPSNVLLYNKKSQEYRNEIFTDFTVDKIFDFTHLRRDLFHKTADTPVIALVVENKPSERKNIEHIVVKRMISTEKKIRFEIDYYDYHSVPWDWAIDEKKQFVWKTNLLGGGRLFHLVYRLNLLKNLGNFIDKKKTENNDWIINIGYITGNKKKKIKAPHIYSKERIITESFNEEGTFKTTIEKAEGFAEPRKPNLFQAPLLILKCSIGNHNIPCTLLDYDMRFKDRFVGIHAPKSHHQDLKNIYKKIKKTHNYLYLFLLWVNSAEALINKENTMSKEDIIALPFPEDEDYLTLSESETILQYDVLNYYIHLGKSIGNQGAGKIFHCKVLKDQMQEFGKTFCNSLNLIYSKNGKSWQLGKIYQTTMFSICQLGFGKNNGLKQDYFKDYDKEIKSLIEDKLSNSGAIYTRVIRIYKHINGYDCLFLIKPHAQRYWLNSIALRDADETFIEFKNAGF